MRRTGAARVCLLEEAVRRAPAGAEVLTEPPRAATVAALGLLRFLSGKRDDPGKLVPAYIRRPEAVERLLRKRRRL